MDALIYIAQLLALATSPIWIALLVFVPGWVLDRLEG